MTVRSSKIVGFMLAAVIVVVATGFPRIGSDVAVGWAMNPAAEGIPAQATVHPADAPTFSEDVAPILIENCAVCHRPLGPGPFSVLTYEDTRPMAQAISLATRERRMPPWLPAPDRGDFADERRLTDDEIRTIQAWVEGGAPEGDSRAMPPVPEFKAGWYLGEPDLIVEMAQPYLVLREHQEMFRHFVIPLPFTGTRWVEAIELRLSDPSTVHHLDMMLDATSASRDMADEDPDPGFDAMNSMGREKMPPGFFMGWAPGRVPDQGDDGLAWPLDGSHDVVLQAHVLPKDRPSEFRASIGFHFRDGPPQRVATIIKLTSETIDIPPGANHHVVTDSYELPVDVDALGVYAHAHYLGREIQVRAILPGGEDRWLLHIPRWDFDWQDAYRYREPVHLPAGTKVTMHIVYDNSEGNVQNPSRTPRRVRYGPRSTDEMGDVYLRVLPRDSADLDSLGSDLTLKWVEDKIAGLSYRLSLDPQDVNTLVELGDLYFSFRAFARAAAPYRRALELSPDEPDVLYSLGVTVLEQGMEEEAAGHFGRLTELRPEDARAHNALAIVLVRLDRVEEGITRYRRAVELDPNLAEAQRNLAVLLLNRGETGRGFRHALRAVEAYGAAGDVGEAAELAAQILELAEAVGEAEVAEQSQRLLKRFQR